ncbi:MAG: hypothetical protein ABWJ99_03070 [Caldimicrobium sp.]
MQENLQIKASEIEQAQKEYIIRTFHDLIKALKDHPDWLEELRKSVLTADLLDVPKKLDELIAKFETFKTEEFQPLKKKVDKIEQDVEILKQDVEILKQDVEILKKDVGVLKVDVANLKGDNFERKVREKAPAYFGKLFRKVKVIPIEIWAEKLDEAEEKNLITEEERNEALLTDILIRCLRKTDKKEILLAVEASVTADKKDAKRALIRADIFYRIYQIETIPVVITTKVSDHIIKAFPTVLFIKAEVE